ncbi:MAG: AMP-dependent synthetase/ligase [Candidatus Bipolaricaulaceae bacterium]
MNDQLPTVPDLLARSARAHGRHVALRMPMLRQRRFSFREITYGELWQLAGRLAVWLSGQGINRGDRVALIAKPTVGWAVAFCSVQRLGAVAVPLDAGLRPGEIARILRESEAKLMFCAPERYEDLLPLAEQVPSLDEVVSVEAMPGALSLWELMPEEADAPPLPDLTSEDLAVLMYTSGTTDDPKGVMLCHRNLASNVLGVLEAIRVTPDDRMVTIVPWYHIYGLTATLLAPLGAGATISYTDDYRNLIEVARRCGATILVGVPKLYHALWRRMRENFEGSLLRRLLFRVAPRLLGRIVKRRLLTRDFRFFVSGGAPLAAEVGAGLRRLGLGVIEGYGLTETAPVLTLSEPFTRRVGTVGRPLRGVEIRVERPDASGFGEVMARGPNVMLGYYKNPRRTAEVLTEDGWFHTGDLGYCDPQGHLFLAGRKKNVIVLESGKNVYPEELEWEFSQIPEVDEVLVHEVRKGGQPAVGAMVYPDWEALRRAGMEDEQGALELLWERFKEAQKNLAVFKRIKSKDDLKLVEEPFEKSTKQEIKRHLYVP